MNLLYLFAGAVLMLPTALSAQTVVPPPKPAAVTKETPKPPSVLQPGTTNYQARIESGAEVVTAQTDCD
jgi:hypothetical protein